MSDKGGKQTGVVLLIERDRTGQIARYEKADGAVFYCEKVIDLIGKQFIYYCR